MSNQPVAEPIGANGLQRVWLTYQLLRVFAYCVRRHHSTERCPHRSYPQLHHATRLFSPPFDHFYLVPPSYPVVAMLSTTLIVAATLLLVALFTLPTSSIAQPPPVPHTPTAFLHGWQVDNFAISRNPATPYLLYVVDGSSRLIALDARDGRVIRNISYVDSREWFGNIAVDNRGYVYALAFNVDDGYLMNVFDESLELLKTVKLQTLQPPVTLSYALQVVVDSTNSVYLFSSSPGRKIDGQVWVLSPRQWIQQASWQAPIQLSNNRTAYYRMAIDSQDYLYFQAINGYKNLYITDQQGALQMNYQMGTGNRSEPWIDDLVIDSQGQMWHTLSGSTYVTVFDSSASLVAVYNLLSSDFPLWTVHIDVDLTGNVVVADTVEQSLLIVSPRGDIVNSLAPQVPSMWYLTQLLADYGDPAMGRSGSLLFGQYGSPYVVQRISVDDRDAGTLLQRYSLPGRLQSSCYDSTLDVGTQTNNLYVLLQCWETRGWISTYYSLLYVMSRSGRVVSEFRVATESYLVRADERTGTVYVAVYDPSGDAIVAYSMVDGSQLTNFTTSNPTLDHISAMVVLPPTSQTYAMLVLVDIYNLRFVNIDPTGASAPIVQPFPDNTVCDDVAFSPHHPDNAVYYVSCVYNNYANNSFSQSAFVHKYDVTDPSNPRLTDTYVPPFGLAIYFGDVVVGLDKHLYAYDWITGSVWQWRDADGVSAVSQQHPQLDGPQIHVGQTFVGSVQTKQPDVSLGAAMEQRGTQSPHRRMRGARSS